MYPLLPNMQDFTLIRACINRTLKVLAEENEVQPNGKVFKKLRLASDYKFITYKQFDELLDLTGR